MRLDILLQCSSYEEKEKGDTSREVVFGNMELEQMNRGRQK